MQPLERNRNYYPPTTLPLDITERLLHFYEESSIMETIILDSLDLSSIPKTLSPYLSFCDQLFELRAADCKLTQLPITSHP